MRISTAAQRTEQKDFSTRRKYEKNGKAQMASKDLELEGKNDSSKNTIWQNAINNGNKRCYTFDN